MNKCNLIISLVIIPFFLQAQEISYSIKAELDSKEKIIKVNQKMKFLNNSKMEISEISRSPPVNSRGKTFPLKQHNVFS